MGIQDTAGATTAPRIAVSIVIPVKDDSDELSRCLAALSGQTVQPNEIIVVDNGSSDDSAEVAVDAGVTLVRCSEPGIPAASGRGYDEATGDLILRLDADCVPPPSWVQDMAAAFANRPDVAAFTGGAVFLDGPRALRAPLAAIYLIGYAAATTPALGHLPIFGSNFGMRREAWQSIRSAVHRHDVEVHDDLDLAFHLGARHRIRYLGGSAMGISMRPFGSARAFRRRIHRGARTVTVHWPLDFPPVRWVRLALRDRLFAPVPARAAAE